MNQHQHDHSHGHHEHKPGHEQKPARQFHKDWRVWVGVIAMLVALGVYILSLDDRFRLAPAPAPDAAAPGAPGR